MGRTTIETDPRLESSDGIQHTVTLSASRSVGHREPQMSPQRVYWPGSASIFTSKSTDPGQKPAGMTILFTLVRQTRIPSLSAGRSVGPVAGIHLHLFTARQAPRMWFQSLSTAPQPNNPGSNRAPAPAGLRHRTYRCARRVADPVPCCTVAVRSTQSLDGRSWAPTSSSGLPR